MANMSEGADLSESARVPEDLFSESVNESQLGEAVKLNEEVNQNLPKDFVGEPENESKLEEDVELSEDDTESNEEDTESSEEEESDEDVESSEEEDSNEEEDLDKKSNEEEGDVVEPINETKLEEVMETTNEEANQKLPENFLAVPKNETKLEEDVKSNEETEDFVVEPVNETKFEEAMETNEEMGEEVAEDFVVEPENKLEENQEVVQKLPENVGEPKIDEISSTNKDVDESENCTMEPEVENDIEEARKNVDENVVGIVAQEPDSTCEEAVTNDQDEKRGRKRKAIEMKDEDGSNSEKSKKPKPENVQTPVAKKQKLEIDITSPKFLKPFELGWKREFVYRNTNQSTRINGDIYYYTPAGKKLRSLREVGENLQDDVTIENFTFCKKPLGLDDPKKEIVRNANSKPGIPKKDTTKPSVPKMKTPKPTKIKTPKKSTFATPEVIVTTTPLLKVNLRKSTQEATKSKTKEKIVETLTTPKLPKMDVQLKKRKRTVSFTETKWSQPKKNKLIATDNFFQDVAARYNVFLNVFNYLKVEDLLTAGCVSKTWNFMANNRSLWQTVRMKNSHLHSCKGMVNMLKKNGTLHLDLRKTLLPDNGSDDFWNEFATRIKKVKTLKKIELRRCPAKVVENLSLSNPKLEVINAVNINSENMDIKKLANLQNLQELYLRSTSSFSLTPNLNALTELKHLKHLSLTSIDNLSQLDLSVIGNLTHLKSLSLGDCVDLPPSFPAEVLSKLEGLEELRLEKGEGNFCTLEILAEVRNLRHLEKLELVNFDLKTDFDHALGACTNIKKLLLIPNYTEQSSLTIHVVLGGVMRIRPTLTHFVWGITTELIKTTNFLTEKYENLPDDLNNARNRIAVLKPIPNLDNLMENLPVQDEVEIMSLSEVQLLLLKNLPSTHVKILKIPFSATWRQSLQVW